jgi:hypothetical protein
MQRLLLLIVACMVATSASADERTEKVRALMEAQGLLTTMQQQLTAGRERGRAMAVAQTVARATGNQIEVMDMLEGVNSTIGKLIAHTAAMRSW